MVTTIQIDEKTLLLLKKLKEELQVRSYEEAIKKIIIDKTIQRAKKQSMAGSLKKYMKKQTTKEIVKELQDERRKSGRL